MALVGAVEGLADLGGTGGGVGGNPAEGVGGKGLLRSTRGWGETHYKEPSKL